jgi:hypothetical protein
LQAPEPHLHAFATIGVTCQAAERLLRVTTANRLATVAIAVNVGDLLTPPREVVVEIGSAEQVRPAVESLVALVDECGPSFARAYGSIEAFIDALVADDPLHAATRIPAALVACGEEEEARTALARYAQIDDTEGFRMFSARMMRFLSGETTLEELEREVPPSL